MDFFDERMLPADLREDIANLQREQMNNESARVDLYWCQVYGGIGALQHSDLITKDEADYLRSKYLGMEIYG